MLKPGCNTKRIGDIITLTSMLRSAPYSPPVNCIHSLHVCMCSAHSPTLVPLTLSHHSYSISYQGSSISIIQPYSVIHYLVFPFSVFNIHKNTPGWKILNNQRVSFYTFHYYILMCISKIITWYLINLLFLIIRNVEFNFNCVIRMTYQLERCSNIMKAEIWTTVTILISYSVQMNRIE